MPSRRRFLAAVGAASAAGLAGCLDESRYAPGTDDSTEWPMPAYDRGFTAFNPDAAAPRDGVTERWATEVPWPSDRPVIASGRVLVPTAEALVALDLDSGDERWRRGTEQPWITAPVVRDGTAYVGAADRPGVSAIDVETGDEQWQTDTEGHVGAAPTFDWDSRHLYVGDDLGHVYQIDPATGEVGLRTEVFGPVTAVAHTTSLLVGTESGEVYDFYPQHGELTGLWRRKVDGSVTALSGGDNGIYAATFGGPVYHLQDGAHAGSSRWEAERGANHLAVASDDVVGSDMAGIQTFNTRTGERGWERDGELDVAPAIAGDTVYVGGRPEERDEVGFVAAYALSGGPGVGPVRIGGKRWEHEVASPVTRGVAVADGAVFAVTRGTDGDPSQVYALDPA